MSRNTFLTSTRPRSVSRGITSLLRNQRETIVRLRQQLEECRILSDEAADAICTVDLKGILTYANKAQARLLKLPRQKIIGTHFRNYLDPTDLPKAYAFFKRAKSGQRIHDELNVVDSRGNLIPVDFHTIPLYKNGQVHTIHTIVRDISRRKKLADLQVESQKMQALNIFISGAAQEIKYPLQAMSDRLRRLWQQYNNRDFEYLGYKEFQHIMNTIEAVSKQMQYCYDLTERLINLNKKNLGIVKEECDMNETVHKSVVSLDEQFMYPGTRIKLRLAPRLPQAAISAMELRQVIGIILTNAVQAMPTGGEIVIKTFYDKGKDRVGLEIKDQGVGIKKENLPQVFEPFFTTKQTGLQKSSGLGLSIAYSIVHAYRGDITIESHLRVGTTVEVVFPSRKK